MLKIHCPECNRSFFWTDDMPTQGKCPTLDCDRHYDIHAELKRNVNKSEPQEKSKALHCPSCEGEIVSRLTICPHCNLIVLGSSTLKKSSLFIAICLILIVLFLIFQYWVKLN
jgi:hypothetical protein